MKALAISLLLLAGAATAASALEPREAVADGRQPMRYHQTEPILFPYSLLNSGLLSGEARVMVSVDSHGVITDILVVGYTHQQFAEAAVRAIKAWKYEPARIDGAPVASQIELSVSFEARGVVLSIDPSTDLSYHLLRFQSTKAYGPCPMKQLDAIPTPLEFVQPVYPEELRQRGVQGSATVEFYIDETGAVRMPSVKHADFWELGSLAISAIEQWKFAPPTRAGKPVLVKVQQRFVFDGAADR